MSSTETMAGPKMKEQPSRAVPHKPLEIHLGYWLRLVSNHVSGSFAGALQARQLSVAEWVALNHIDRRADITAAQLADTMNMTRGAVSKIVDKLARKQCIVRVSSPSDNRAQLLSLTSSGKRTLPRLRAIADDNDERFFGRLDAAERTELRRLLQKLADVHAINTVPVD
jgi:DNA-binding MarR family transcriptional regulator